MLEKAIERRFGLLDKKVSQLAHLLFLGASVYGLVVMTYSLAGSLFIAKVGPQSLPLAYILVGTISIPLYSWFSQIVDRYSHERLFQGLLAIGLVSSLILRWLLASDSVIVYYLLFIGIYFQWTIHTDILFPSLISDYFNTLERKRYVPFLTMAQAIGGMIGGGSLSVLAAHFSPRNLLLVMPVLYVAIAFQLFYLERTQDKVETTTSSASSKPPPTAADNWKALPMLLRRYPIVYYLTSSKALWIILYSLAEFQYFSIYSDFFQQRPQDLTQFLGVFNGFNNIAQLLLLYFCTRPLLAKLGVKRMNILYPLTTAVGFLGLALQRGFPVAMYLQLNNGALDTAFDQPVTNLNYNAVPYTFTGRLRSFIDGLFFSIGLVFAGAFLWVGQSIMPPQQMVWLGLILSLVFVVVRYFTAQSYLKSLLSMLRAGSVSLGDVSEGLTQLPPHYAAQVGQLLTGDDRKEQLLGLELAARIDRPSRFITEIEALLSRNDPKLAAAAVTLFGKTDDPGIIAYLRDRIKANDEGIQRIALEALLANKEQLTDDEIRPLVRAEDAQIQALACVAARDADSRDTEIAGVCQHLWESDLEDTTKRAIVRGIRNTGNPKLIPLLRDILIHASAEVTVEGLNGLAELNPVGDTQLAELATTELDHPDPLVRVAATNLLGAIRSPEFMPQVGRGLEDLDLNVRLRAAEALAKYGDRCLPLVEKFLDSSRPEQTEAAIAAAAKVNTRRARNLLYSYLKPDYDRVGRILHWRRQIPGDRRAWQSLDVTLKDYCDRVVQRVLHAVASFGHKQTLVYVRQILGTKDARRRANAVEALASIKHRRFVVPILPLIEYAEDGSDSRSRFGVDRDRAHKLLEAAFASDDRWIRIGAVLVLAAENYPPPDALFKERDRLVKDVANRAFCLDKNGRTQDNSNIERVLFFKTTPLLGSLSLDELLPISRAFQKKAFETGQTIYQEGDLATELCVVYRGKVAEKTGQTELYFNTGDHFGIDNLFAGGAEIRYTSTWVADSDCTLLVLSRDSFLILNDLFPKLLACLSQMSLGF